jgi:transposase
MKYFGEFNRVVRDNIRIAARRLRRQGVNKTSLLIERPRGMSWSDFTNAVGAVLLRPVDLGEEFGSAGAETAHLAGVEFGDVRIADNTVEVFHKGQQIASHARAPNRRGHTTVADHMPSAHRRYGKWTPGGLIAASEKIGPSTAAFFQAVIADRPHPEQGFRTCLGILALTKSYGNARVDAACQRGILINARSVASIRSILKTGLDRAFLDDTPDPQPLRHGNIRGQGYFH